MKRRTSALFPSCEDGDADLVNLTDGIAEVPSGVGRLWAFDLLRCGCLVWWAVCLSSHLQRLTVAGYYVQREGLYVWIVHGDPEHVRSFNGPPPAGWFGAVGLGDPVVHHLPAPPELETYSTSGWWKGIVCWAVNPEVLRVLLVGVGPVPQNTFSQLLHRLIPPVPGCVADARGTEGTPGRRVRSRCIRARGTVRCIPRRWWTGDPDCAAPKE